MQINAIFAKTDSIREKETHKVLMKEIEKMHKYLDPARESKKPWNMKVKGLPIVAIVLRKVSKFLEKRRGWKWEEESKLSRPHNF